MEITMKKHYNVSYKTEMGKCVSDNLHGLIRPLSTDCNCFEDTSMPLLVTDTQTNKVGHGKEFAH